MTYIPFEFDLKCFSVERKQNREDWEFKSHVYGDAICAYATEKGAAKCHCVATGGVGWSDTRNTSMSNCRSYVNVPPPPAPLSEAIGNGGGAGFDTSSPFVGRSHTPAELSVTGGGGGG